MIKERITLTTCRAAITTPNTIKATNPTITRLSGNGASKVNRHTASTSDDPPT